MSLIEASQVAQRLPAGWTPENLRVWAGTLRRVLIVSTSWYADLMSALEKSAKNYLLEAGVLESVISYQRVPGSFELPLAIDWELQRHKPDFVVALGCVVQGQTPHFEYVCTAVAQGIQQVQLKAGIPVGFGVLTVKDLEQAWARADKGLEAAQAALWMAALKSEKKE